MVSGPTPPVNPNPSTSLPSNNQPTNNPSDVKTASVWEKFKSFLPFSTKVSNPVIETALKEAKDLTSAQPTTSKTNTENTPVPAVEEDENTVEEGSNNDNAHQIPSGNKTALRIRAPINGVLMEFSITVNGKPIPLTEDMVKELLVPLFEKLTTGNDGKLSRSFACAIDLKDFTNFHIYQNGEEIFKEACAKIIEEDGNIRKKISDLSHMIAQHEVNELNIGDELPKLENPKTSLPEWIEDVKPNGDCLLLSALKHIKGNRKFTDQKAADDLRKEIAEKAATESDRTQQMAIMADIQEARNFAMNPLAGFGSKENADSGLSEKAPFKALFTDEMNAIFGETGRPKATKTDLDPSAWTPAVGAAYKEYLLMENKKAYLGTYALNYLNLTNGNKFVVVKKGKEALSYEPITGLNASEDIKDKWVLLLDTKHYQYIDSLNPDFKKGLEKGIELAAAEERERRQQQQKS